MEAVGLVSDIFNRLMQPQGALSSLKFVSRHLRLVRHTFTSRTADAHPSPHVGEVLARLRFISVGETPCADSKCLTPRWQPAC